MINSKNVYFAPVAAPLFYLRQKGLSALKYSRSRNVCKNHLPCIFIQALSPIPAAVESTAAGCPWALPEGLRRYGAPSPDGALIP